MKFIFSFVFLACFFLPLAAQENMHMLFSHDPLPAWVNQNPSVYNNRVMQKRKAAGIKIDEAGAAQILASTQTQYSYLSSGRLLFNDEIGIYLNQLADSLLRNDSVTRNQLKIYVYYSAGNNAICFPNGLILIELGLIAQMENEDEMAFMLSHEIAHYMDGDFYTEENPVKPDRENFDGDLTKFLDFKHDREEEADLFAFELYKKAKFSQGQALRAFDIMQRNWMVPISMPFTISIFEDSAFHYPTEYDSLSDRPASGLQESFFNSSTQESFATRKSKLAVYYKLDTANIKAKQGSNEFNKLNNLAVYNCGLVSLERQHFSAALYAGYYLRHDPKNREVADLLIDKVLYQVVASTSGSPKNANTPVTESIKWERKMANVFSWSTQEKNDPDLRGYIYPVDLFLQKLTSPEAMLLSINWSWNYYLSTIKFKSIAELICKNSCELFNLYTIGPVDSLGSYPIPDHYDYSNYSEPRKDTTGFIRDLEKQNSDKSFKTISKEIYKRDYDYSVREVKNAPKMLYKYTSTQLAIISRDSLFLNFYYSNFLLQDILNQQLEENKFERLTSDSIYLLGSRHVWLREHHHSENFNVNAKKSERKTQKIAMRIQLIAKGNRMKLLSVPSASEILTIDSYNNFCVAQRVFSEIILSEDKYFVLPLAYQTEFDSISQKNGVTEGIVDIAVTKQFSKIRWPLYFFTCLILPPTAPIVIIYYLFPEKFTYRQTVLYNLKTGTIDHTWIKTGKGTAGALRSNPYYTSLFASVKKRKSKAK